MGLSGNNIDKANPGRTHNLFNYFRSLGYHSNVELSEERNGFGMVFYLSDSANTRSGVVIPADGTEDRRFATRFGNATQVSTNFTPDTNSLRIIREFINYSDMRTVIGHKRRGTSGQMGIANPHPFVYRYGGRSYTFAHNGTVTNHIGRMLSFIIANSDYLTSYPELQFVYDTGMINEYDRLDSAVYFTYLLIHIKAQGMDILRGLQNALYAPPWAYQWFPDNNQLNFVFTDGYDLYAYRNGQHELWWHHNPVRNIAMVTTRNRNFNNAWNNNNLTIGNLFFNINWPPQDAIHVSQGLLENRELIYIPQHGLPTRFKNFSLTPTNYDVSMTRKLRGGWNYHGLVVVPYFTPNLRTFINFHYQRENSHMLSNPLFVNRIVPECPLSVSFYTPMHSWIWDDYFIFNHVHQNIGLKLHRPDSTVVVNNILTRVRPADITTVGRLAPIVPYTTTFLPWNDCPQPNTMPNRYFVTYNLTSGQSVKDAFGPYFDRIERVYAENWTYHRTYIHKPEVAPKSRGIPIHPSLNSNRPMEFGKTYIIELRSGATPITNFQWTDSRMVATGRLPRLTQHFAFEEQEEYEAIDIISLRKSPLECVEIGVFAGEICIGAARVDEFPVQILIYSAGFEGIPLTFRALYPNGIVGQINPIVETFDTKSGVASNKVLVAGEIDYVIANLDNDHDFAGTESQLVVTHHTVYPNPFNPSTTINFAISSSSVVNIEIFNVKGQKVKNLFNDTLSGGNYFLKWHGTDLNNKPVASGIYFYRITAGNHQVTSKMILMK
jgi:hypothetical protein